MNSVSYSNLKVKQNSEKCTNLALTSGERIRKRKFAPPPPPAPVLTIGKLISLELTLAQYEITPNARTAARLDGAQ